MSAHPVWSRSGLQGSTAGRGAHRAGCSAGPFPRVPPPRKSPTAGGRRCRGWPC